MAKKPADRGKKRATGKRTVRAPAARNGRRRQPARRRDLITRVPEPAARSRAAEARAADEADVPEARISSAGGTVTVEITFGHAQHGLYTIQLFDPDGAELAREAGFSTDTLPDRFDLRFTPAQLDRHFVQWSGAVDAFSNTPGQRYSVIFEVSQAGSLVPGGRIEKSGPLNITQAFLGILRLVTS